MTVNYLRSPHAFAANTYLLSSAGECAVVDPTVPYDMAGAPEGVKYILLTHAHFDHILEIDSWALNTGAEVIISEEERPALSDSSRNCYLLFSGENKGYYGEARGVRDGDRLTLGDTEITVIECPGHTSGSVTYLCDGSAFVGDTIFAGGGFGRCDLPTGDYRAIRDSILRLMRLPPETVVYPGHGESTKINEYKIYR